MIRLTMPDGSRMQLEASEIIDVEPIAGGSLIHRAAGDPMKVMQDARTIQTRIDAELDSAGAEDQSTPSMDAESCLITADTLEADLGFGGHYAFDSTR